VLPSDFFYRCSATCREVGAYLLGYQRLTFPYFVLHDHIHSENILRIYHTVLSGVYSSLSPAVDALVTCSSYLHDIGMSLPLSRVNELRISVQEIESDAPAMREKLAKYQGFVKEGVVSLPEEYDERRSVNLPKEVADFIRLIHPWVSAKYVASDQGFKKVLAEEVGCPGAGRCAELRESFLWALSRIVKFHSSKIDLKRQQGEADVGGYRVELVKLAAALRLADSLDISRSRAKHAFDVWRRLVEDKPSQLKHWLFKWSISRVDLLPGRVSVEVTPSEDRVEETAKVIGVAVFELGHNVAKDYNSYLEVVGKPLQFYMRTPGAREVAVDIEELKHCYEAIEGRRLLPGGDAVSRMLEELRRLFRLESPSQQPDLLDLLASALYRKEGLSEVIRELSRQKCVEKLLQKIYTSGA
jgi:hypothetical protein